MRLSCLGYSPERHHRSATRRPGRQSGARELGRLLLEMELNLLIELAVGALAVHDRADAREQTIQAMHVIRRRSLCRAEDELNRRDIPAPGRQLGAKRLSATRGEPIIFGTPVVLGGAPFAVDPPALLESLERGVERSLIHIERSLRDLFDALADSPPVHGLEG